MAAAASGPGLGDLPDPAWAALLGCLRRHGRAEAVWSLSCACKALRSAVQEHLPAVTYDLRGDLAHAEACGRHLAGLRAPGLRVHIIDNSVPGSVSLYAFTRSIGDRRPHPAVRTLLYDGRVDAGKAAALGRAFGQIHELLGGVMGHFSLRTGSDAAEALRGIADGCRQLHALEVGVRRLAGLRGVGACTELRRLCCFERVPRDAAWRHAGDSDSDGGSDQDSSDSDSDDSRSDGGSGAGRGRRGDQAALEAISTLSQLETLRVQFRDVATPEQLRPLARLARMTSLDCGRGNLTGSGLAMLGRLPALARLSAGGLLELEEAPWQLSQLTRLECTRWAGACGVLVRSCPHLQSATIRAALAIGREGAGVAGMAATSAMPALRRHLRDLYTLHERGLLSDIHVELHCHVHVLRAAWAAELGEAARIPGASSITVYPGAGAWAVDDACWQWLFHHMPSVVVVE